MTAEGSRLSLAYRELTEVHPRVVEKFGNMIKELDLANNKLADAQSIRGFTKLETLVLDNNSLTSHSKFPIIPTLKTLWVNRNQITNLSVFLDKLVEAVPNITYLSMLGNDACPNFFNGGSLKQYNDYRYYVISRLRKLTQLDSSPVTDEERRKAVELYGSLASSVAFEEREREREQQARLAREEEKRNLERSEKERRKAERTKQREQRAEAQRRKREEERRQAEERQREAQLARQELEEPSLSSPSRSAPAKGGAGGAGGEGGDSTALLLPDVAVLGNVGKGTPAGVALPGMTGGGTPSKTGGNNSKAASGLPPPPPFALLEEVEGLTDEEDWSDDDDEGEVPAGAFDILPDLPDLSKRGGPSRRNLDEDDDDWDE